MVSSTQFNQAYPNSVPSGTSYPQAQNPQSSTGQIGSGSSFVAAPHATAGQIPNQTSYNVNHGVQQYQPLQPAVLPAHGSYNLNMTYGTNVTGVGNVPLPQQQQVLVVNSDDPCIITANGQPSQSAYGKEDGIREPVPTLKPHGLYFDSLQDARQSIGRPNWAPILNDATIPATVHDMRHWVNVITTAIYDFSQYLDLDTNKVFLNRMMPVDWVQNGKPGPQPGDVLTNPYNPRHWIEESVWELVEFAFQLHTRGPVVIKSRDPLFLERSFRDAHLTFAQRMNMVADLVRNRKSRVNGIINGKDIEEFVVTPSHLAPQSDSNRVSNVKRQNKLVFASQATGQFNSSLNNNVLTQPGPTPQAQAPRAPRAPRRRRQANVQQNAAPAPMPASLQAPPQMQAAPAGPPVQNQAPSMGNFVQQSHQYQPTQLQSSQYNPSHHPQYQQPTPADTASFGATPVDNANDIMPTAADLIAKGILSHADEQDLVDDRLNASSPVTPISSRRPSKRSFEPSVFDDVPEPSARKQRTLAEVQSTGPSRVSNGARLHQRRRASRFPSSATGFAILKMGILDNKIPPEYDGFGNEANASSEQHVKAQEEASQMEEFQNFQNLLSADMIPLSGPLSASPDTQAANGVQNIASTRVCIQRVHELAGIASTRELTAEEHGELFQYGAENSFPDMAKVLQESDPVAASSEMAVPQPEAPTEQFGEGVIIPGSSQDETHLHIAPHGEVDHEEWQQNDGGEQQDDAGQAGLGGQETYQEHVEEASEGSHQDELLQQEAYHGAALQGYHHEKDHREEQVQVEEVQEEAYADGEYPGYGHQEEVYEQGEHQEDQQQGEELQQENDFQEFQQILFQQEEAANNIAGAFDDSSDPLAWLNDLAAPMPEGDDFFAQFTQSTVSTPAAPGKRKRQDDDDEGEIDSQTGGQKRRRM